MGFKLDKIFKHSVKTAPADSAQTSTPEPPASVKNKTKTVQIVKNVNKGYVDQGLKIEKSTITGNGNGSVNNINGTGNTVNYNFYATPVVTPAATTAEPKEVVAPKNTADIVDPNKGDNQDNGVKHTPKPPLVKKKIIQRPVKVTEPKMYEVAEKDSGEGIAHAQTIVQELRDTFTNNKDIKNTLTKIDDKNAYSFFIQFNASIGSGLNEEVLMNVSDPVDNLEYGDTLKPMQGLLKEANAAGLKDTPAVKAMTDEIAFIQKLGTDKDPDFRQAQNSDKAIADLLLEMSKVVK